MAFTELYETMREKVMRQDVNRLKGKDPFIFQIDITGAEEGSFYVAYQDGALTMEPCANDARDVRILVSGENLRKLLKHELDPFRAFLGGKIRVKGNIAKVMALKDLL